ncbi:hypothetical protein HDU85_007649 [Gaertneriomyces sp. JEL0708]|nr:hypothetical protein HDU85_007649 [Gaertneriomyces sp. JEL0708]
MANQSKPQPSAGFGALVQSAAGRVMPLVGAAQSVALQTYTTSRAVLNKYPPLKAFVYTLAAASAIPVSVFTGYALSAGAVVFGVAGTGAALVQGGVLAFGGFFLFWFLAGAFILACIAAFWFSLAYFAYQIAKRIEGKDH